ncbi:MAG TPA: lasso peptide biosynthesis B2 protein [Novosphingobium sp.]|nr:lasso peptide biosynthesis B2 protein [Novosphingobium sp.]
MAARLARLRRKWRAWRGYAFADRLLIVEAAVWLAAARLFVLLLPFRWLGPWLRKTTTPPDRPALAPRIGRAVLTASRHVPWQAACLPQALAAKLMLGLRGQGAVVHLGAKLDETGALAAHAWLTCGDNLVTGGEGLPGYTPLIQLG